jgi:uncharacterized protein YdhG (YjbR/CyaY superfamily)
MAEPNPVDAYLAAQSEANHAALERMRRVIREELPEASEVISYGLPTFKHRGRAVLAIAGWQKHVAIYPMSYAVMDAHRAELSAYEVDKGTIRFPPGVEFDTALLKTMVRERVAENDARPTKR